VAFVDLDKTNYEPDHILRGHSVQLIVASPPEGTNQPRINLVGFLIPITQLVIQLWSDKELFLTGSVFALLLSRAFVTRLMPLCRIFLYPIDLSFIERSDRPSLEFNHKHCDQSEHERHFNAAASHDSNRWLRHLS